MQIPLGEVIFLCWSFFALGLSISALIFLTTIRDLLRSFLK
jgi:hypothetical protein